MKCTGAPLCLWRHFAILIAMVQATFYFPPDFLWGTATSAYQVEGNNCNSDWWRWEEEGHILEGHRSGRACNWWENAEADLDMAAEMGTNAHRMSLEWSRIEPEPSVFDQTALDRYRQILQAMHDRGIEPMVTLHHFSNPLWLVEKGDFNSELVVDYFRRYVAKAVIALGDLVPKWITINEPMVYVFLRYLNDAFPEPRKRGWGAAMKATRLLLRCHAAAYQTIKELQPSALIGVAKSMQIFEARPPSNRLSRWWAGRVAWLFNQAWMDSMVDGRLRRPFGRGTIPGLAGSFDFVGINYYTRFFVTFPPRPGRFVEAEWGPEATVSDGNYGEIYPQGIYDVIKFALRYEKPIIITENGLPDRADRHRSAFLLTHLHQLWHAINFCYPVMGYYHWSLVDNFEWERGWTQRFGLIALDPETATRHWRPSAHLYREICQTNGFSSEMTARYAPDLLPILFPDGS